MSHLLPQNSMLPKLPIIDKGMTPREDIHTYQLSNKMLSMIVYFVRGNAIRERRDVRIVSIYQYSRSLVIEYWRQ